MRVNIRSLMIILLIVGFSATALAERLAVSAPVANIRSGPGTSHNILFTVEKGIPFKVLKSEGSWIYIEHSDGDKGWIHKALVW